MTAHTFQSLDLSVAEFLEHAQTRRLRPEVRLFEYVNEQTGQRHSIDPPANLLLQSITAQGVVHYQQDQVLGVHQLPVAAIEKGACPTPDLLAHIYSGNSHTCTDTKAKLKARRTASEKSGINDVELRVFEVRSTTMKATLPCIDGSSVVLDAGTAFDVGNATKLPGFRLLRASRRGQHAVVKVEDLDIFSSLIVDEDEQLEAIDDEIDLEQGIEEVQELHVVCQDVYACGVRGIKIPLKKGDKMLMHHKSKDLVWLRDTKGRPVVLTGSAASSSLTDMRVEELVTGGLTYFEEEAYKRSQLTQLQPWSFHTLHSDNVQPGVSPGFAPGQQRPTARQAAFGCPRNGAGLPLPIQSWRPTEGPYPNGDNPFGYWEFASEEDQALALSLRLTSAARTIFAATSGRRGLGDINIEWVPGDFEGSQGAGFGPCCAYIHIYIINFRRKWAFGKDAVPSGELPVYTGSDPFWHEAKGANTQFLDSLKSTTAHPNNSIPTEQSLFAQARDRQGFAARSLPIPSDNLELNAPGLSAQHWQRALLQASDRSTRLGGRLTNENPINPGQAQSLITSFHPQHADCGFRVKMHDSNYLLQDQQSSKAEIFSEGKKGLSVVQAGLPLLNADGESVSTIVMVQTTRVIEHELLDVPCLPKAISAEEDFSLLEAFHRLTMDWNQVVARMSEADRSYANGYNSEVWKMRHTYRISQKQALGTGDTLNNAEKAHFNASVQDRPITNAHIAQNTLRGCAVGKVDPNSAKDAHVRDLAGNQVINWVPYPQCDVHPTLKLQKQHDLLEKKALTNRANLVQQQAQAERDGLKEQEESDEDGDAVYEEDGEVNAAVAERHDGNAQSANPPQPPDGQAGGILGKDSRIFEGHLYACVHCGEMALHREECPFKP